jgi:hypothetical protein
VSVFFLFCASIASSSNLGYSAAGNRTAQRVGGVTTEYVLDVGGGLPEVIVATTGGAGAGSNPGGVRGRSVEISGAGWLALSGATGCDAAG